jgi:hypothetical protein
MASDRLTGRTLQSWYPLEDEVSASSNAPSMSIDPRPHLGPTTTAFVDETADGADAVAGDPSGPSGPTGDRFVIGRWFGAGPHDQ